MERELVAFQMSFPGGQGRALEAITSGGGTRSINLAFESVLFEAQQMGLRASDVTVLTGNPHLAVERAERRFGFKLRRLDANGATLTPALPRANIARNSICELILTVCSVSSYTHGI